MNFKDIDIKCDKNSVELKFYNEKIVLYKSTFEKVRTCYCFAQENASSEFVKCVFNNINFVGIDMDIQSKKYFIDVENESEFEYIFDGLEYIPHSNFSRLYFKSYRTFKN